MACFCMKADSVLGSKRVCFKDGFNRAEEAANWLTRRKNGPEVIDRVDRDE